MEKYETKKVGVDIGNRWQVCGMFCSRSMLVNVNLKLEIKAKKKLVVIYIGV